MHSLSATAEMVLNYKKLLNIGIKTLLGLLVMVALFFVSVYAGFWGRLPTKSELADFQYQRASEVFSADSVLIGKYYLYDRQPITYDDLPAALIESLIAIEDRRFYRHSGVDYPSFFRVGIKTVLLGQSSAGGGSTISQQLVKNLYPRKARQRYHLIIDKLKEMIIARRIENVFSKEDVLTHYLNTVSFGDNTFGIESASLRFFNKSASQLRTEEAAVLTGMLKATYSYNPRLFPDRSLARRNLVLRAMEDTGYLNSDEADSLIALPLLLNYKKYDHNEGIAPYFREEVRKWMEDWCARQNDQGENYNLYTSGLKIYTTLNYKMQLLAEASMKKHLSGLQRDFEKSYGSTAPWIADKGLIRKIITNSEVYQSWIGKGHSEQEAWDSVHLKKSMVLTDWSGNQEVRASSADSLRHYLKFLNTGSLSIDPYTGAVKTWIGGIDYEHFKYDHISQSRRQVGSSFKPIVYTAALEEGIKPCTHFSAREIAYENLEGWSPGNSTEEDETFLNYSMEQALSKSVNTVSVKILEKAGIPATITMAKKMGIQSTLPQQPSLALGTGELTIEEMAGAYASFVNHGKPVVPFLIQSVTDDQGEILQVFHKQKEFSPAFSEENRLIMLELMKSVVDDGTASRIRNRYGLRNDIAGKTGTTQNNKDAWFVAVMPKLVHVSWVGLDHHEIGFKNTSMGQGANAALPLFALWLQELNQDPVFKPITRAKFPPLDAKTTMALDCDPIVRDNFFKRLFKNPNKKKKKKFKERN